MTYSTWTKEEPDKDDEEDVDTYVYYFNDKVSVSLECEKDFYDSEMMIYTAIFEIDSIEYYYEEDEFTIRRNLTKAKERAIEFAEDQIQYLKILYACLPGIENETSAGLVAKLEEAEREAEEEDDEENFEDKEYKPLELSEDYTKEELDEKINKYLINKFDNE